MTQMSGTGMHVELGTTLVELLVVLGILASMTGIGAVALGTLEAKRLDRETALTYEWLKALRREAMLHGTVYRVLSKGPRLEADPRLTTMNLRQSGRIQVVARSENQVWKSLCFFPDGSACPGYLELAGSGGKRRLMVNWFGTITVLSVE